jgi:hypothetical protein
LTRHSGHDVSRATRAAAGAGGDPFASLGLPATGEATDDDVRAAWRRIAAATHPDRDDGGDPARFAAAAAAYATLRTSYDRGEALADLRTPVHHARTPVGTPVRALARIPARAFARVPARAFPRIPARAFARIPDRHFGNVGRGLVPLGVRVVVAAAVSAGAVVAAGWSPGAFGVLAGAAAWVIAAARRASGTP